MDCNCPDRRALPVHRSNVDRRIPGRCRRDPGGRHARSGETSEAGQAGGDEDSGKAAAKTAVVVTPPSQTPVPTEEALPPPPAEVQPALTALPGGLTKPNIIFVLTDDLAINLLQYMPNVQKMQKDGTSFSRYFVTDSLCCPSRSSIFTGEFPHDTAVFTNTGAGRRRLRRLREAGLSNEDLRAGAAGRRLQAGDARQIPQRLRADQKRP